VQDLVVLDDALKYRLAAAKARFAVYLGDLGATPPRTAREILAKVPTPDNAVLLAVSPNQRAIEVVYGASQGRGIEESARSGVGGRRVVQGGQPDRRPDQRRPGAQRGRITALSPAALCAVALRGSRSTRQECAPRRAASGAATCDLVIALAGVAGRARRHDVVHRVSPAARDRHDDSRAAVPVGRPQ
jgi:hypothetical protein